MNVIKAGLATHRLTKLALGDDFITQDLHARITSRIDEEKHPKLAYLATCPWCVSMYAGAAVVVVEKFLPELNTVLAASSVTGLISSNLVE